jgi:hypothetical protein
MERKNGKGGTVLIRLNRAAIWTFCLALAATIVWQHRAPTDMSGRGSQGMGRNAGGKGLHAPPEARPQAGSTKDQNLVGARHPVGSVPSVTPAATDLPVDGHQSVMPSYLARGERFHPLIVRVSKEHNVDPALVKAIIMAESGYNPQAVSKEGAGGLMQLMPRTADSLGVQDIFDPEDNVSGGVKYLKQLLNEFGGEIKLALAAYNAGSRKVRTYNGVPPIGATQVYIKKVIEYYQHYRKRFTGPRETA